MEDNLTDHIKEEKENSDYQTVMACIAVDLENGATGYGYSNIRVKNPSIEFDLNDNENTLEQYNKILEPSYTAQMVSNGEINNDVKKRIG